MVAMETMHFFIEQKRLSLTTKSLCISGVPMNDLASVKDFLGGDVQGRSNYPLGYPQINVLNVAIEQARYFIFSQNKSTFARPKKIQTLVFILPKDSTKQLYQRIFC